MTLSRLQTQAHWVPACAGMTQFNLRGYPAHMIERSVTAAETRCCGNRVMHILMGAYHSLFQRNAFCQLDGNRGGVGAPRSVHVLGMNARRFEYVRSASGHQRIDQ